MCGERWRLKSRLISDDEYRACLLKVIQLVNEEILALTFGNVSPSYEASRMFSSFVRPLEPAYHTQRKRLGEI